MVNIFDIGIEIPTLLFCILIYIFYNFRIDKYESSRAFQVTIEIEIVMLICDIFECCSEYFYMPAVVTNISLTVDFMLSYIFGYAFHRYIVKKIEEVRDEKYPPAIYTVPLMITLVMCILLIINIYTGIIFTVNANNEVFYGWTLIPANGILLVVTAIDYSLVYKNRKILPENNHTLFIIYLCLIIFAIPADTLFNTSFTYVAFGLIIGLNIMNLYIEQERILHMTRLNTLHLQMRPHFIYNTLASIAGLCYIEPRKAAEYIGIFSKYLRISFGEMGNRKVVPFEKELEHLRLYLSIEKLRFADMKIHESFDVTDFQMPCLTVQPLVENAIKHGICGRETGGTLNLSSYETEKEYIIRVEDDGVGFEQIPKDGSNHIGINNVRNRLEILGMGWLEITSIPNCGTVAKIHITKQNEAGR